MLGATWADYQGLFILGTAEVIRAVSSLCSHRLCGKPVHRYLHFTGKETEALAPGWTVRNCVAAWSSLYRQNACLVSFLWFCCSEKILWQKQFWGKLFLWLTLPGHSPSSLGSQGGRNLKKICTFHPQEEERAMNLCMHSSVQHNVPFSFSPGPSLWSGAIHIQGGSSHLDEPN